MQSLYAILVLWIRRSDRDPPNSVRTFLRSWNRIMHFYVTKGCSKKNLSNTKRGIVRWPNWYGRINMNEWDWTWPKSIKRQTLICRGWPSLRFRVLMQILCLLFVCVHKLWLTHFFLYTSHLKCTKILYQNTCSFI